MVAAIGRCFSGVRASAGVGVGVGEGVRGGYTRAAARMRLTVASVCSESAGANCWSRSCMALCQSRGA